MSKTSSIVSQNPKFLNRRWISRSRVFHVEEVQLRFANGAERVFERLRPRSDPQSVVVVPLRDEDTVLLVREYGVGIERYHIGLPRGAVNEGETVLESANRELKEEVGYGARNIVHLRRLALSPNYMGSITDIVLARDLYEERLPGDEPETLEVVPWSLSKLDALLECEEFWESYSLSALYMARDYLRSAK